MFKAIAVAAAGLSMGFASNTPYVAAHASPLPNQCVATIDSPITAGAPMQEVTVSVSEELMDSVSVAFPPESKLSVSSITRDVGKNLLKLQVDASKGMAGTWNLTLKGQNTSCKGQLTVKPK